MTIEDDIAFLQQVPILGRLGADALRILAIGAESYSVAADQVLFAAGDAADCAYVIQQGSFTLKPQRQSDAEVIAEPGTLLGETALLAETVRPATAVAREQSAVLRVSRTMFMKMLESYPEAAQRVREMIASRADRWTREMENIRAVLARGTGPR
ncbi:MAG TPA: cyclic nucleotide-binding domain-containing protein [Xanthobacteraceae bacterium]|jgi:CRP-like cAMP-binding protein|nr:cyclic nucleotide-binding domain-containing protein [Xanthobacteraceae bacterium]